MNFMEQLRNAAAENSCSVTENGAVGYATTGHKLLDVFFESANSRKKEPGVLWDEFSSAMAETPLEAVKYLFFNRDVRGGNGERRYFRVIFPRLLRISHGEEREALMRLLPLVPEYGRWDDLLCLVGKVDEKVDAAVFSIVGDTLDSDMNAMSSGESVSLLSKWMPSENASSKETKGLALTFIRALKFTPREYRKRLSKLRKYIDVVERKMSSGEWGAIDYEKVPSKANLVYKNAFMRHDLARREDFLNAAVKGVAKINSSALYPYEIVWKYRESFGRGVDKSLEALWNQLPAPSSGSKAAIVVCDGSGSMVARVDSKSGLQRMDVARSIALYSAQYLPDGFKDKYITFSQNPRFVDVSGCSTLRSKILEADGHCECENTDIEAVFDLLLKTAMKNGLPSDGIPTVMIVSDMEFDEARGARTWGAPVASAEKTFDAIKRKYDEAGYKMPKLVFWRVGGSTGTIPMIENKSGLILMSGFSRELFDMAMSNDIDPWKVLVNKLGSPRYDAIENALLER